jgi:hypothetical protein
MRRSRYYSPVRLTALHAFKRSPHYSVPVIGPSGKPLYGAAAAVYLHHKGRKFPRARRSR